MRFNSVRFESLRFLIVGASITALNFILYMASISFFGLPPTVAAAFVFIILIPLHFYSQAHVVFKSDAVSRRMLLRYIMALALSFALNVGLVDFYWRILLTAPASAQILGIIPAIVANYLIFRFFVFQTSRILSIKPINIFYMATLFLAFYSLIIIGLLYVVPRLLATYGDHFRDFGLFRVLLLFE